MPTFKEFLAWPIGPGGTLRAAQGQRVNVYNPGTTTVPAGLTQNGQAVQWVTSDAMGTAAFTTTSANVVDIATPDGTFSRRVESVENVGAGGGGGSGTTIIDNGNGTWTESTVTGYTKAQDDTLLAAKVPTSRTVSAGTGLSGGGDLSANRTLAVSYGTTAGTAAQGNDARITGALQAVDAPELIRDTIGTALVAGSNVTITPNDAGDTITIAASTGGGGSVDGPPPGAVTPLNFWVAPYNLTGTKTGKSIGSTRASYLVVPGTITVDQVGIQVTTAEAGKNAKLLIYSSTSTGLPASLAIDSGPLSLAATGNVTATLGTAAVLTPGIYWGFVVTDGTTGQIECASQDIRQNVADTFNRVRNTLNEWWDASPGTYAAPASFISSFSWSSYGSNTNLAPIWAMRRSA